jgi:hypothetical protein
VEEPVHSVVKVPSFTLIEVIMCFAPHDHDRSHILSKLAIAITFISDV